MSKKSRRRNKRLLLAALVGGAAMMGRGKGKVSTAGQPVGVNRMSPNAPPIGGTDHIKKAVVADAAADTAPVISKNKFRTRGGITDSAGNMIDSAGMTLNRRIPGAVAPPSILNPYRAPRGTGPRRFSKGGSVKKAKVTGVAKRGFGRALMKGKK